MAFHRLFADILLWSATLRLKSTSSGFAAMWCIKNDLMQMFCECVGWHSYEKNHNSIMFVWGLFCTLRIALKPDRKYAVRLISKTAISSSGRADDNRDCCMVRGSRPRWRSNFSKLFWIRSLLSSLQSGTLPLFGYSGRVRPMKKAHTGESGLKWEAKDSSKLIGNKDHALRGYHRRWSGFGKSGWLRRE